MEALSGLFNLDYVFDYDIDGAFACGEQFHKAKFFDLMKEMGGREGVREKLPRSKAAL